MSFFGVILAGIGLFLVIAPRAVWTATRSWAYRDPDANEPSGISFFFWRAGGVALICLGLAMVVFDIVQGVQKSDEEAARMACEPVKEELRDHWPTLTYKTRGEALEIINDLAAKFDATANPASRDYDITAADGSWKLTIVTTDPLADELRITSATCPGESEPKWESK